MVVVGVTNPRDIIEQAIADHPKRVMPPSYYEGEADAILAALDEHYYRIPRPGVVGHDEAIEQAWREWSYAKAANGELPPSKYLDRDQWEKEREALAAAIRAAADESGDARDAVSAPSTPPGDGAHESPTCTCSVGWSDTWKGLHDWGCPAASERTPDA